MWALFVDMSLYLLVGFLVAGVLNLIISKEKIYKHLAGNDFKSVVKASIFGVPLPLCSCGVIPVAAYLRKEGAGKGPTVSFIASTPTTGVDSILVTYSLLGPLFAVARPLAAFFAGLFSGQLINLTGSSEEAKVNPPGGVDCSLCDLSTPHAHTVLDKIRKVFRYAFLDLIDDLGKWILIGILVGGAISYIIPADFIERYLASPLVAYPLMLLISIPMYICTIGSIPIATSLILGGMSPGAGLVFLIAGPATNAALLSFVAGKLGKKVAIIYVSSIIFTAVLSGLIFEGIWYALGRDVNLFVSHAKILPERLKLLAAVLLAGLILNSYLKKALPKRTRRKGRGAEKVSTDAGKIYKVPDMTCKHCVGLIEKALNDISGIEEYEVSLEGKFVRVKGAFDEAALAKGIEEIGFTVEV